MNAKISVEQFRSMTTALKAHPDIDVLSCRFNSPATEQEVNEARSKFNLTPAMLDFYSEANGISIQWQRRWQKEPRGGGLVAGMIELLPIQDVFGDWKDNIYFGEDDPCKLLHPLDYFMGNACAGLYLDGSDNPEVYYYYRGEKMRPLNVDFEGYLQLLLKSRGFWYWPLAIAGPEEVEPSAPIPIEERNFREIMPQLFPDFNPSDFQRLNRNNV